MKMLWLENPLETNGTEVILSALMFGATVYLLVIGLSLVKEKHLVNQKKKKAKEQGADIKLNVERKK
ncbi:MAG: hypothetical protein MUO82_00710 [Candidatus Thermoplasmatota archaeon]|nr:hypothetical protein [Candidatus Thermoplasmatota archaeon]